MVRVDFFIAFFCDGYADFNLGFWDSRIMLPVVRSKSVVDDGREDEEIYYPNNN